MRDGLYSLLVGVGLCGVSGLLIGGCNSGEVTQGTDGGPGGASDLSTSGGSGDMAGSMANPDLYGSSNPEADPKLQGITALHNQARANVSPQPATPIPPLMWDNTVAMAAQAVANKCVFQHSNNGYGENLYASTNTATPAAVVNYWMMEAQSYNYSTNTCSSICGHYTQVVWRNTTSVGCAEKTCTTGSPFGSGSWYFVVCDYNPPGNFTGQKPY